MPELHRLEKNLALYLLALMALSCSSLRSPDEIAEHEVFSSGPYPSSPYGVYGSGEKNSTSLRVNPPNESPDFDDLDQVVVEEESLSAEGFCEDDLYATYLKEHYIKQRHPRSEENSTAPQALSADQEAEALSFATSNLSPEASAYFGEMPVVITPEVEHWLRYFKTTGRFDFAKWLLRGEALAPQLHPVLKKEGLPLEFFYLAMIESGFNNSAVSIAHAAGPWQLVAGTARRYGLTITPWIDERLDPVKSTLAAAKYLRALHRQFGDWYLAIAAYNAGPLRIENAITRTKSRDFWRLCQDKQLRPETKQFVPKILAALILGSSPREHGFNLHKNAVERFPSEAVVLDKPVALPQIAQLLGVSEKHLKKWNPELLRGVTPPRGGAKSKGYSLRVPLAYVERFEEIKGQLTQVALNEVKMHRVVQGENLARIARTYKVSVKKLQVLNPTLNPQKLKAGQMVAVPVYEKARS